MKAIVITQPGPPEVLKIQEVKDPQLHPGELLVRVRAAALNNADILQRRGLYPPPPGVSELLGLDIAGEVEAVGTHVQGWKPGDKIMALLPGGGYAEKAVIPSGMAMQIPSNLSFEQASAIPEAFLTAYLELVILAGLKKGETVLIHAGGSGVGTAAIQIARDLGARVFTTAGSEEKLLKCQKLGAEILIHYQNEDFAEKVLSSTQGQGVDCILDLVGAAYWQKNIQSLAIGGRYLLVGLSSGAKTEIDLRALMNKRIHIIASTLRARPELEKIQLTQKFAQYALPRFTDGKFIPVVDKVFQFEDVVESHHYLEKKLNFGKVILSLKP